MTAFGPAYYNEIDPYAAQWLRNLIAENLIVPGDVDERSIVDVQAADVAGYRQCHFFAGIGGWSYALRLAGWPDDRPVWTGSCPCQPFSEVGQGGGFDDPRHLWPAWARLVRECRPAVVFGEQISAPLGIAWLDVVLSDLEAARYTVGAAVGPAAGVGAPHGRHRTWFVAHADESGCEIGRRTYGEDRQEARDDSDAGMAHPAGLGLEGRSISLVRQRSANFGSLSSGSGELRSMGDASGSRPSVGFGRAGDDGTERSAPTIGASRTGAWADGEITECADGRLRWIKPGLRLLADGVPARVGQLRALGNAIVPQVAAEFIGAFMDCCPGNGDF